MFVRKGFTATRVIRPLFHWIVHVVTFVLQALAWTGISVRLALTVLGLICTVSLTALFAMRVRFVVLRHCPILMVSAVLDSIVHWDPLTVWAKLLMRQTIPVQLDLIVRLGRWRRLLVHLVHLILLAGNTLLPSA
jgi:hypothetical protein